ncbi:MAG: hypothetical protein WC325_06540 [Candidatus Bathyarchaeia archaeon]|jgi:hypothetical protein
MASERQNEPTAFSWTAPQGLLIIGLFVAVALVSELVIVSVFAGSGLTDLSMLPVSPLFHIVPVAVVVVLVSSWIYLTNHVANQPRRVTPTKPTKTRTSRHRHAKPKKAGFLDSVSNFFGTIFDDIDSSAQKRLSFDRLALENILAVMVIFLLSIIFFAVIVYPRIFTDFAVNLYLTTSPAQGIMQGLANALAPIAGGLNGVATAFGNGFEWLLRATTSSLTESDLMVGYIFCQNAAAGISAIAVLVYVRYFTKPSYIRSK